MSIAIMVFLLFTNLTSCTTEEPILPPITEEPAPPVNPDDDDSDGNPTDSIPRMRIVVAGQTLTVTLYDNPTARDFASRLPLTVNISDFASTEKIFTPSPELTIQGSPLGCHPKAGDIASYIPWRNIAIYYQDGSSFSEDMISVGRIDGDISALRVQGTLRNVRFELITENSLKINNYE